MQGRVYDRPVDKKTVGRSRRERRLQSPMKRWTDLDDASKAIIETLIEDVRHLPWFEDLDPTCLDRCSASGDSLLHSAAILAALGTSAGAEIHD